MFSLKFLISIILVCPIQQNGLVLSHHIHHESCSGFHMGENKTCIHTNSGHIVGSTDMRTRFGNIVYAFRGIRYGQPPVGELRFKAPVPVETWHGKPFIASEEGPSCPQPVIGTPFAQSEDCLRLNVYYSHLKNSDQTKKPVMVFFHAGGFYSVSGQSLFVGPQYLLDKDIVLVTVNYRLASLGFLATGDKNAYGNYGLKDQVIALRWIRDNIEAFGGDPNQVTIFGYSAGGTSVALHLLSPMSKGLFHRAVSMSGSPVNQLEYASHQYHLAEKQAKVMGCPSTNSAEIVQCLKIKEAKDIAATFFNFQEIGDDPTLIWTPVVEPEHEGERFLTDSPLKLFKQGKYVKVPFMTGVTEKEFIKIAYGVVGNETLLKEWNDDFYRAAPIGFVYERDTLRSRNITDHLKEFYLQNKSIDKGNVDKFGQMYAESLIGFSVNRLAHLVASTNTYPTYYYKFSYKGTHSHFYLPGTKETVGPVHHDDLIYLFHVKLAFPFIDANNPEGFIVDRMTTMWTNFAKYGNPTPKKSSILNDAIWEPYNLQKKRYMDIGSKMEMRNGDYFADRYALWDKLFPIPECY